MTTRPVRSYRCPRRRARARARVCTADRCRPRLAAVGTPTSRPASVDARKLALPAAQRCERSLGVVSEESEASFKALLRQRQRRGQRKNRSRGLAMSLLGDRCADWPGRHERVLVDSEFALLGEHLPPVRQCGPHARRGVPCEENFESAVRRPSKKLQERPAARRQHHGPDWPPGRAAPLDRPRRLCREPEHRLRRRPWRVELALARCPGEARDLRGQHTRVAAAGGAAHTPAQACGECGRSSAAVAREPQRCPVRRAVTLSLRARERRFELLRRDGQRAPQRAGPIEGKQ